MAKVLIWLASGDLEKLKPGILYGTNARKHGWVDDVQFVVFGESERLMLQEFRGHNSISCITHHLQPVSPHGSPISTRHSRLSPSRHATGCPLHEHLQ